VLVDQQNNASLKATFAKALSDHKYGLLHEGIAGCQPKKGGFARRNPPKASQFFPAIAALSAFSRQAISHLQFPGVR
jgi:hypothetical protein